MSVIQNELEQATELAVTVVLGAIQKVLNNDKFNKEERTSVGQAIAVLVVVTGGTPILSPIVDVLKSKEADTTTEVTKGSFGEAAFPKPAVLPPLERAAAAAGGRRRRQRGGVPAIITLLIGALGILFAATTTSNIVMSKAELDEVLTTARSHISSACPLDLQLGPPAQKLIDWRGENARALRSFKASKATCDAVKTAQQARIDVAQAELQTIMSLLPDRVGLLSTAASVAVAGPQGFTGPGLAAATSVGAAMRQVTASVIEGTLPKDLTKFAKELSAAFPIAQAEAAPAAEEEGARGRRTGGRKTKKRAPKRRITRRRPKFVY